MARKKKPETARDLSREIAKNSIVTQALSRLIEQIMDEVHTSNIKPLRSALVDLVMHARTSGGMAGPDAELIASCERAEKILGLEDIA